ncbi:MAG: mechanosensitive ion channel [Balneolaceae bacterium]|nr:mechanosensitive ion channel [Balneolaceae bacterium]MBO6545706.1 mechanosensitive ion channel [Balneolaceae bacterium]MBO6647102.1 mechanosensitive ion channel [Balneolaceae bacterium]
MNEFLNQQPDSSSIAQDSTIIETDSTFVLPNPTDYSIGEIFIYVRDFLNVTLFEIQNTPVTFMSIIIFILFIVGFSFLASFVKKVLNKRVLPKFIKDSGLRYTLARMSQYVIVIIGIFVSFQFLGINLTGLAVIFGFLSVGIGFGLQNVTSNFISGLIVLFERPISVGDRVEVNDIEGDVQEINIRSTKVRTLDNISIIVPNSQFVSQDVVNYSHGDPTYRLSVNVGVAYGSDLDKVLKALNEVAEESENVLKNPSHDVHLRNFGDSAWDMKLLVWIPDVKDKYAILNELNQAIVRKFREMEIEIPFPQRDINFRNAIPEEEQKRADSGSESES